MKIQIEYSPNLAGGTGLFSFNFGEAVCYRRRFAMTSAEVAQVADDKRPPLMAIMDLSRVVIVERGRLRIVETETDYPRTDYSRDDLKCEAFLIDTRRFFRAAQKAAAGVKGEFLGSVKFAFDIERFRGRPDTTRRAFTVMELMNRQADKFGRSRFAKSLLSFRTLTAEQWQRLMEQMSMIASDGGALYGAGDGEIGFNWCGMWGAMIRRGDEYSSHT